MRSAENDKTFRELEREVFDAFELPGQEEVIDRLYASDFLAINADASVTDKQEVVDIVEAGEFPADTISNDESHVRRFGDTAVVTGRSRYFLDGEETTVIRHTQIWTKRDDRWKMVA